jgi:hypothetical protein
VDDTKVRIESDILEGVIEDEVVEDRIESTPGTVGGDDALARSRVRDPVARFDIVQTARVLEPTNRG